MFDNVVQEDRLNKMSWGLHTGTSSLVWQQNIRGAIRA